MSATARPQHVPRFDWDEARRRYAAGERVADLAVEYGVSLMAIYRVLNPRIRERMDIAKNEWQRSGRCPDCGTPTTRVSGRGSSRCKGCSYIAAGTSARSGELRCISCKEWKPDEDFPHDHKRIARRGRHRQCRLCQTVARRDHRRRNREAENAYQREYKRRRRAAQPTAEEVGQPVRGTGLFDS